MWKTTRSGLIGAGAWGSIMLGCGSNAAPAGSTNGPESGPVGGSPAPIKPAPAVEFPSTARVRIGDAHSCAVSAAGELWCWGLNTFGALAGAALSDRCELMVGLGDQPPRTRNAVPCTARPVLVPVPFGRVRDVTLTQHGTCLLTERGEVYCSGGVASMLGAAGEQLPVCGSMNAATDAIMQVRCSQNFHKVAGAENVRRLASMHSDTRGLDLLCTLDVSGTVRCWGEHKWATSAARLSDAVELAADPSDAQACARLSDGSVQCWDEFVKDGAPITVSALTGARELTMGGGRVCGIAGERAVCAAPFGKEVELPAVDKVRSVAVGTFHVCIVDGAGTLRCTGKPALPDGQATEAARALSHGRAACFQRLDGALYCWSDYNHRGTLGVGDRSSHASPTRVLLSAALPR